MEIQIQVQAQTGLTEQDLEKMAKAKAKRARQRSKQRNAKNGHVNAYKLSIINDMFAKEPRGYATTNSHGRKYYTLDGTTVRID